MPRGGKKPVNPHNSRHENGVVAPGKRITKQKSNGHINGAAEGVSQVNGTPTSLSSSARATSRQADGAVSGEPFSLGSELSGKQETNETLPKSLPEVTTALHHGSGEVTGLLENTHHKIDVRSSTSRRQNGSVWQSTLTVLRSCPLGDTISILIILLSLPSTILHLINLLFAILTFITPTGASLLPSTFNEIFQGSGGTPSLATIFLTDFLGLILWLMLWTPLKDLAVELSQAVVATQLGGGNASKKKNSDRTMVCMGIVTIGHIARNQWLPQRLFGYDWSAILSSIPYVSRNRPLFSTNDLIPERSRMDWFHTLLALHILIQGLVHVARRWYQKREYSKPLALNKKPDYEALTHLPNRSSGTPTPDISSQISVMGADGISKHSASSIRDARDKISSGKKKRKQGAYVRSQQPLWAAFAHTKVSVLREYEQSHSHTEDEKTSATDARNLGNAQFLTEQGRIWISQVLPTSFRFNASHLSSPSSLENGIQETKGNANTTVDASKPFYVRINETDWTSTRIERNEGEDECIDGDWTGEVFGLSPSSSYKCSFVQKTDGAILYAATVTTLSLPSDETDLSVATVPLSHQVQRPSSPTSPATTLKNSISVAEANLNESQSRQKRNRKETKVASAALKREIDILTSKTTKLGVEEKQHQTRNRQWNEKTKQADDATNAITNEIESLGELPEDDLRLSNDTKVDWDESKDRLSLAQEALFDAKSAAHQLRSSIQTEAISAQQKKERLLARKNKLTDQHERLQASTSQGSGEKERKDSQQAAKEMERLQLEQQDYENITILQRAIQENSQQTAQISQQAIILQNAYNEKQRLENAQPERPLTPEGDLPGTVPHKAQHSNSRFPSFGSSEISNGLRSHSGSLRNSETRPRSTSGLSSGTVYVDFENDDLAPPMPSRAAEIVRERGRKESGGSASGSSGSQRDPTSPTLGTNARISPVSKGSPVWNQG